MHRHFLIALLAAAAAACGGAEDPSPATTTAPAAAPAPATTSGTAPFYVYVTNETSGDLTIIDPTSTSAVATIPLGKRPRGIAGSPDRTLLYVALSGSPVAGPGVDESKLPPPDRSADGIGVVNIAERRLVKVLTSGPDPEQVAVRQDGTRLYVANEDAARMSVVDAATGEITQTFAIGEEPE